MGRYQNNFGIGPLENCEKGKNMASRNK